tara:strand:+ start:247 stop:552 length:306 start_codon:yes stop_codon:yes gene_type:complete
MSSSDHLLKATVNCLASKLSEKAVDVVEKITTLTDKAPDKIRKEWEAFKKDVKEEAERLSNESDPNPEDFNSQSNASSNTKQTINRIRSKISDLGSEVDNQ